MKKHTSMLLVMILLFTYFLSAGNKIVFASTNKTLSSVITKMEKKEAVKIVCYGDSITWGLTANDEERNPYPAVLQELLRAKYGYDQITVYNYGYCGRQSDELASKSYISKVLSRKADLVIFMCGINDCKGSLAGGDPLTVAQYKNNLESIITTLSSSAFIIMTPTNFSVKTNTEDMAIKFLAYVQAVKEVAKEKNVELIDLNYLVNEDVNTIYAGDYSKIQIDGIHFTRWYYSTIALYVFEHLKYHNIASYLTGGNTQHKFFRLSGFVHKIK